MDMYDADVNSIPRPTHTQRKARKVQAGENRRKKEEAYYVSVKNEISKDGNQLRYYKNFQDDEIIVSIALKQNHLSLKYVSDTLKNYKETVLNVLQQDGLALKNVSDDLKDTDEIVLTAVNQTGLALIYASNRLIDDFAIVSAAINQEGMSFMFASDRLKDDKRIVLIAVKKRGGLLEHISTDLRDDEDIITAAMTQDKETELYLCTYSYGSFYEPSKNKLHDHKNILSKVNQDGLYFKYASERLRNTYELVLLAVIQKGKNLEHASPIFKNDYNIVFAAVTNTGDALEFASEQLRGDYIIVNTAIDNQKDQSKNSALQFASKELCKDPTIVLNAIKYCGKAILYAAEELQNDGDFILSAVTITGCVIFNIDKRFYNTEIILNAIYNCRTLLRSSRFYELPCVRKCIQNNILFALKCYLSNQFSSLCADVFRHDFTGIFNESFKKYNREMVFDDVCGTPLGLACIRPKIFNISVYKENTNDFFCCKCRLSSGNEFVFNISITMSFNNLAKEIYKLPEFQTNILQNIIFLYQYEDDPQKHIIFDLNNYAQSVVCEFQKYKIIITI